MIIDNDQPMLNLFRSRIIFILNLEWRKRELWNTWRCIVWCTWWKAKVTPNFKRPPPHLLILFTACSPNVWRNFEGKPVWSIFLISLQNREWFQKLKLKFEIAFAIRLRTLLPHPPLMAQISIHFFYPTLFFCNWILHIWNGFYTSKISLLSPLIIGSELTFITSSGRWLPTI